jgi:hypothetical protein
MRYMLVANATSAFSHVGVVCAKPHVGVVCAKPRGSNDDLSGGGRHHRHAYQCVSGFGHQDWQSRRDDDSTGTGRWEDTPACRK